MKDNNEQKVRRGEKLSIPAATWNNVVTGMREFKRTQWNPNVPVNNNIPSSTQERFNTALIKNTSDYDLELAFQVVRLSNSTHPLYASNGLQYDRISFDGEQPNSIDNAIAIVQTPLEIDQIGVGVFAGITYCRVEMVNPAHQWANPIPGEHRRLKSADTGQVRILSVVATGDAGEDAANIRYALVNLIGSKNAGDDGSVDIFSCEECAYIHLLEGYDLYTINDVPTSEGVTINSKHYSIVIDPDTETLTLIPDTGPSILGHLSKCNCPCFTFLFKRKELFPSEPLASSVCDRGYELTICQVGIGSIPGSSGGGSSAPGSSAPGSSAPGSSAPGSSAPGSSAPGSSAPGSSAPGSSAPGSSAPGSVAPSVGSVGESVVFD